MPRLVLGLNEVMNTFLDEGTWNACPSGLWVNFSFLKSYIPEIQKRASTNCSFHAMSRHRLRIVYTPKENLNSTMHNALSNEN